MALNERQRRFVEVYDGNGTKAARVAGYRGTAKVLAVTAWELLRKPEIKQAIRERRAKEAGSLIATRQERQEFWSSTMNDPTVPLRERLKASELLGKSEADFTEKHELSGAVSVQVIDPYAEPKEKA